MADAFSRPPPKRPETYRPATNLGPVSAPVAASGFSTPPPSRYPEIPGLNLTSNLLQKSPNVQRTAARMEQATSENVQDAEEPAATPEFRLEDMPGMRRPDSMWDNPSMEVVGEKLAENLPSAFRGTKTGLKSVPAATRQMTSGVNMMLNSKAPERIEQMARESYAQNIRDGVPEPQARRTLDRALAWAERERGDLGSAAQKNLTATQEVAALQNPKADRVEKAFAQGIPSAVQSAAVGIPAAVLSGGNPVVAGGAIAAVLGTGSAGARYAELIHAGVPEDKAQRSAALLGTLEGLTEAIPGGTLVKANKPLLKRGLDFLIQDLVGENISTTAQMVDDYANGLRPDITLDDWVEAVKQTTAAALVGGGAQISAQKLLESTVKAANELKKGNANLRTAKPAGKVNLTAGPSETQFDAGAAPTETQFTTPPPAPPTEEAPQPAVDAVPLVAPAPAPPIERPQEMPGPEYSAGGVTFKDHGDGAFTATDETGTILASLEGAEETAAEGEQSQAVLNSLREYASQRVPRETSVDKSVEKLAGQRGTSGFGQRESQVDQPVGDRVLADAKLFGQDTDAQSLLTTGFEGLQRDRQQVVVSQVRRSLNDKQVLRAVIKAVPVDVVHQLVGKEVSPEALLNDPAMLAHALAVPSDVPVPKAVSRFMDELARNSLGGGGTGLGAKTTAQDNGKAAAASLATGSGKTQEFTVAGQKVSVNTSPSEAQIKAGIYKKGHITFQGLPITIETPIGVNREGRDENGRKWSRAMEANYGYVKGTEGADGDHVDIFMGKDANPQAENAYVIDQLNKDGKAFDEHKVILGANSEAEAVDIYRSHYPKNWKGMGAVTAITMDRFKTWVSRGVRKEPIAWVPQADRNQAKVQVEHDSILEAIAKTKLHGATGKGLSIDALSKEGLDPEDMKALRGMGITRPFSKKGAASLDAMAERLFELGYPVTDEAGNYSANKLLELITDEMAGNKVYSQHKEHESPEGKRAAQIEQFMQTYEPPEDVFGISDESLDHYIAMIESIEEQRRGGGEPDAQVMFHTQKSKQTDLFGDAVATKNELQRLIAERDRRRNSGQQSAETGDPGDLFSQARNQVDIQDVKATATPATPVATSTPKPATQAAKPVKKPEAAGLSDAGEKIGGARKDRWQDRGMNLSDLEDMSETEAAKLVTKGAAWKPDYAAMIEGGMPVDVAAGVKVLWDKLGAKPRENTPAGRRQYLKGLGMLRGMLSEARTEQDLNGLEGKLSAALQVDWRQREADGYKTFWSIQKGRRSSLGFHWTEKQSAKKLVAAGFPSAEPWTRLFKLSGAGGRGITDRGVELILKEAAEVGTPLTAEQLREGVYYVRRKSGGNALGYATSKEDAEALAATIYEREKSGPDKDKPPERPHLDTVKRTGKKVRERDATPEDFLKDFGFRGIEFGNWAANDERQKLVNLAYDALHDLAMVLKITPDALSLDGRLGLALGARGGGFGLAHYEPGKLVINMTKINGAGSLAHEWGHALDHYFGELDRADAYTTDARGASGWYTMPRLSTNENLRPPMQAAFKNLMGAMFKRNRTKAMAVREAELTLEKHEGVLAGEEKRLAAAKEGGPSSAHFASRLAVWIAEYKPTVARARRNLDVVREKTEDDPTFGKTDTQYAKHAAALSGKGSSGKLGYWQRPTEMFARAFESYVFDQLAGKELTSEYLVHGVEGERYAEHPKGNPYPAGSERTAINAAFDELFTTIQSRKGEKGTVLFHTARGATLVAGPVTLPEVLRDTNPSQDMAVNFSRLQMGHYTKQEGQTAHLANPVSLPTSMIEGLSETRPHSRPQDQGNIEDIASSMRVNGYDERFPILLTVNKAGIASIFDGNHRIQAAAAAGINEVPVMVTYLNGGEKVDWKFSPDKLGDVAMGHAAEKPTGPVSKQIQVQTAVERALEQFQVKPPVTVFSTFDDMPKAMYQRIGGARAKLNGVNAFIDFSAAGARMYFVADRFQSDQQVTEVLMHEMTHYGLENVVKPEEWKEISEGILRDQKDRVQAIIKREARAVDMADPKHKARVVHEVLAYMNQKYQTGKPFTPVEEKWWNRVVRAIRAAFSKLGLTGPVYTDAYISDLLDKMTARMRSGRVQAGKGDIPGFVNQNPLANQTPPPFYSAVARAVKESKTTKAPAAQWWATLNNKPGVKPEELEWLGLQDWLKEQNGPVTKEALEAFFAANEIQVHDVVKGAAGTTSRRDELIVGMSAAGYELDRDMDGSVIGLRNIQSGENYPYDYDEETFLDDDGKSPPQRVIDMAMEYGLITNDDNPGEDGETQFAQYTLPGGENYREILLTLPEKDTITTERVPAPNGWGDTEGGNVGIHRRGDHGSDYRSSHWREPNIVAHIRTKDRTDADGKKVLFVEEIQSDWHQAGRKRGYKGRIDLAAMERRMEEIRIRRATIAPDKHLPGMQEEFDALGVEMHALGKEIDSERYDLKVPDAPFKTTWPELAFKRVLRMAAEEGYDRIAWTTGAQQNARYSLDDVVDYIHVYRASDGAKTATVKTLRHSQIKIDFKDDGTITADTIGGEMAGKTLSEVFGEEMARKIVAAPDATTLRGDALKIEGAGMVGFYDQMLPAMVSKLTKKWGGKVGEIRLQRTTGPEMPAKSEIIRSILDYADGGIDLEELSNQVGTEVTDSDVMHLTDDPYRKDLNRKIASGLADELLRRGKGQAGSKQHGLDITDPMRQAALQGLPLFNRGDMAEQQQAILEGHVSLEEDTLRSRAWNWLVFRAQDKFNDVLRLQKEAKKYRDDMAIPEKLDTYMRETLYHGRTEYRFEAYDKQFVQPLLKLVKGSGYDYDQVEQYLYARHAPEANAHIKKVTASHPDLFAENEDEWHSGMTDEQAAAVMENLRAAGNFQKLEAIGEHVDAMTKFRRDMLVSEGLEDPVVVGSWEAAYKHYVPLRGWADKPERSRHPPRGRGFDTGVRRDKRRTGRKTLAGNIMATLVGQAQATIILAEKAKVGRAFLDFAKTHPSDLYEVNNVEMERYFDERAGIVRERPVFRGLSADNLLNVKVDGKNQWIEFNQDDPQAMRMATAFKNLSAKEMNGILTFLLGVNRFLATINTSLNPEFVVSNMFRDLQTAMVNITATDAKELRAKVLRDWRKAFGGIMSGEFGKGQTKWAKYFDDFKRAGAKTGWIDFTTNPADLEEKLREGLADRNVWNVSKHGIKAVLETVDKVNLAVENAIRLSVFVNARENGMSEDKAAELAKNLTVNFNRKGDWGTELNAMYLFYNAAAQGTAVLWNAAKNKHARRVMYGMAAIAVAMQIINRIVGGEDEDGENRYDKIPAHERAKNIIVMLPKSWRFKLESGDEVDHLKVPLPYGYNMVYYSGAMAGDILDYNFFGYKHRLDVGGMAASWISEFIGAYNPIGSTASLVQTVAPTILDPAIALYENKNWFGGRIYPEASQFDVAPPNSQNYYRNASDVSKLVAQTFNEMTGGSDQTPGVIDIPPNAIDFVADQVYGGLGRFVENTGRTVLNSALSPEKMDIGQVPFARRVLGQTGDRYIADTYYERSEQVRYLEKERDAMQQLEVGSDARIKKEQYIASNYATAERLYAASKAADGRISRLRKEKRALQEQKGQVEDKPRSERIRQIDQDIQDEMQKFNTEWNLIEDANRSPGTIRDLFGRIQPEIGGKTKPEAVASLRKAGLPAMAALMDAMPFRPRAAMTDKYRKELES